MTAGQLLIRKLPKAASFAMATAGVSSFHNNPSHQRFQTTLCEQEKVSTTGTERPTLMVALAGASFGKKDFENVLARRQGDTELQVQEVPFPTVFNLGLQERLQSLLEAYGRVDIAPGGNLGQSGAIPKDRAAEMTMIAQDQTKPAPKESLILMRGGVDLVDGISLAEAFIDLCDEAAQLKDERDYETKKKKALSWWQRFLRLIKSMYYYSLGSLKAFLQFWTLYLKTEENPFQNMIDLIDGSAQGNGHPNISWAQLGTVEEVKQVADSLKKQRRNVTINDIVVSCVSAAVARQIQEHHMGFELDQSKSRNIKLPSSINVMVKGREGPNASGALFAPVPSDITSTAGQRLEHVHDALTNAHQTTLHFWSNFRARLMTMFSSEEPAPLQPNVAFLVSSAEAPKRHIHLAGRQVEVFQGFAPLPEGVPIGIFVTTYAGKIGISITAAPWAVPDPEKFLTWVKDEYKFLYTESPAALID